MALSLVIGIPCFYLTTKGFLLHFKQDASSLGYFKNATNFFFYPSLLIAAFFLYVQWGNYSSNLRYKKIEANIVIEFDKTQPYSLLVFTKEGYKAEEAHISCYANNSESRGKNFFQKNQLAH